MLETASGGHNHSVYPYVGTIELAAEVVGRTARTSVRTVDDVDAWMRSTELTGPNLAVATFIVDLDGCLWIADRHSEHVACANGQSVLSAGEMTFERHGSVIEVTAITNQSLGYCPDPSSWPAVAAALDSAAIAHPGGFTFAYVIRTCLKCAVCAQALINKP